MSDEQRHGGPPMLILTNALKSPKVRVGHIGGNITLPRTIPLTSLLVGGGGAAFGILVGFAIIGGVGPSVYCAVLGGAAGVGAVTWSPLKGESLLKWLGLRANTRRKALTMDGEPVQLAVGIARLGDVVTGNVHIVPGAVQIPPSQYDERGVPIDPEDLFHRLLASRGTNLPQQSPDVLAAHSISDESLLARSGGLQGTQALGHHRQAVEDARTTRSGLRATARVNVETRAAAPYTPPVFEDPLASIFDDSADEDLTNLFTEDDYEAVDPMATTVPTDQATGTRFGVPQVTSPSGPSGGWSSVSVPADKSEDTSVGADGWIKLTP